MRPVALEMVVRDFTLRRAAPPRGVCELRPAGWAAGRCASWHGVRYVTEVQAELVLDRPEAASLRRLITSQGDLTGTIQT
jgi:hypothetical protein